jgi:hypothetical protein
MKGKQYSLATKLLEVVVFAMTTPMHGSALLVHLQVLAAGFTNTTCRKYLTRISHSCC